MLFGSCGYGLVTQRGWATHVSFFLIAGMVGVVVFDSSILSAPPFLMFVLMIVTLPFITFLEIVEIMNWRMFRRQSA
jgi:hypothetical protein